MNDGVAHAHEDAGHDAFERVDKGLLGHYHLWSEDIRWREGVAEIVMEVFEEFGR